MKTRLLTIVRHGMRNYVRVYPKAQVYWRSWRLGPLFLGLVRLPDRALVLRRHQTLTQLWWRL